MLSVTPPRIFLSDDLRENPELITHVMLKIKQEMEDDICRNAIKASARQAVIHHLQLNEEVPRHILKQLFS